MSKEFEKKKYLTNSIIFLPFQVGKHYFLNDNLSEKLRYPQNIFFPTE
jgi:hypothetical protein